PGTPTAVTATAGDSQVTIDFTAPASDGGAAITTYTATATPGGATGTCNGPDACTITVSNLDNGTAYTFAVTASNSKGASAAATVGPVTPKAEQTISFSVPASYNFGTTPTLNATSSAELVVSFTSSTTDVCTVESDNTLAFIKAGVCTIIASQPGDSATNASTSVTHTFDVNAVAPRAP